MLVGPQPAALQTMGEAALELCLPAHAADDAEARSSLASVLCRLGVEDDRVFAALTARLARADGEVGIAASALTSDGDARPLPNLIRALNEYEVEPEALNSRSRFWIERAKRASAGSPAEGRLNWLSQLRGACALSVDAKSASILRCRRQRRIVLADLVRSPDPDIIEPCAAIETLGGRLSAAAA